MEFRDAVGRRRMWRTFQDRELGEGVLDRILDVARRGPSAGFSQGVAFLALEGREQTDRFWGAVARDGDRWLGEGTRRAAALLVPFASKGAYLARYAEEDKGWTDRDEARWPVPYWTVDAAFGAMLALLAAVDEGLGALFFGLDGVGYDALRRAFGVPAEWEPIGVIAVGHPAPDDVGSSRDSRPRRPRGEVVHRGTW